MAGKQARALAIVALAMAAAACEVGEGIDPTEHRTLALIDLATPLDALAREFEELGAPIRRTHELIGVIRFDATDRALAAIAAHPRVRAIEPVLGVDGDFAAETFRPFLGLQDSQVVPWGVARVGAPIEVGAGAATLWILDTGVDLEHPDLNVDRALSTDLVVQFEDDADEPDTAHATAVAGVAAALDNGRDVVGVAPGAKVVSVRVLDAGGAGRTDVFVAGLDYVAKNAAPGDVVNLSLTAPGHSEVLEQAIARLAERGVSIVIAAGNRGADAEGFTPAALEHVGVYTVSAVGQDDCLASFSNYGAVVDVAAPGEDVLTLKPGGGIVVAEGTSLAAPHVAGLLVAGSFGGDGFACGDHDERREPIASAN